MTLESCEITFGGENVKKIGFFDKESGEYCESYVAVIQPKRRNGFDGGWAAMAQTALDFLADNRKSLGEEGFAVFAKLIGQMSHENFIQVNQTELGKELGMQRQNVQRAIKRLMALGVMLEGPKVGRCRTYRLNPHVGWKGSAANHKKALKSADHLRLVSSNPERDPNTADMFGDE